MRRPQVVVQRRPVAELLRAVGAGDPLPVVGGADVAVEGGTAGEFAVALIAFEPGN